MSEEQEKQLWIEREEKKIEAKMRELGVTDEKQIEQQKGRASFEYATRDEMTQEEIVESFENEEKE